MNKAKNYLEINRNSWNKKTEVHINSEFYNQDSFLKGQSFLNNIELELLGDVSGKKILHLQCHFGQDSISLSRLGADVTGVDLSDKSIETARQIAEQTQQTTQFICSDVYDLSNHLDEKFDIVFTSYGTISWLPDLDRWAKIISDFLKPGGKLVFVEFHPVVWMFDDNFEKIGYNYFNTEPIIESENGTYADKSADISQENITWNHSLSEVFTSLLNNGLEILSFNEIDYSPYNCFSNTVEFEPGKFRIKHFENKIPMVYSLVAKKKI
ncbi:Methyltransferase domain-containing protein [Epilithonimonas bovis DSM 19482]|uniref:Methyltransferase domain-containing protein n=1 Tax=Epilithonimonas bovis DSM 19482 TaxID=1121284 RepID=A0A1U7PZP5_9FLAO|nr:class I SAM-dependent methyltransferase [Epilithonimonas bovis]SIT97553.1 Methyltransferase domain-containing protein [Epilithonimonas bovis DSM 19482]